MAQVQQAIHVWIWKIAEELTIAGLPCAGSPCSVINNQGAKAVLSAPGSMRSFS